MKVTGKAKPYRTSVGRAAPVAPFWYSVRRSLVCGAGYYWRL